MWTSNLMAAERDPRWWKVDDDPLEAHHRGPKNHQAARMMATGGNAESMCK
ncbi:MAG: hypothetical protein CM15mP6_3240 [Methanobacteriota archaeon]|nr:MAG: hypothetical protein CM15mP6_3240 [Euryarchaeota archaeon]